MILVVFFFDGYMLKKKNTIQTHSHTKKKRAKKNKYKKKERCLHSNFFF